MSSRKVLEEQLNEFQPVPSPRFYRRLARAPWTPAGRARRRMFGGVISALLLTAILLAVTPQGRAWAQEILYFFERAGSDTLPLPASQTAEPIPPTRTSAPTHIVGLQEATAAENGGESLTPTPLYQGEYGETIWGLSVAEAQELAGFEVRVPASLPPGYRLDNVIFDTRTGEVIQLYVFSPYQSGEFFVLVQSPSRPSDMIGSRATVESLDIGGILVEYVAGMWFVEAGSVTEQWISGQPVHTFRWQAGTSYFTLQLWVNETFSPAYLTREDMIAMVEIVMGNRTVFPERLNFNNLTSIEEAEEAADFDILAPTVLPEGFVFSHASYEPGQRMVLIYVPEDSSRQSSGVRMVIFESVVTTSGADVSWDGFPSGAVETVTIGDTTGVFVRGAVVDGVYDPDLGLSLSWEADGLQVSIHFWNSESQPVRLERDQLILIAESMR